MFCYTGSQDNYFGSVGRQNNYNNPKSQGLPSINKNMEHWGKETCAMLGLPIQNKNRAINVIKYYKHRNIPIFNII